MAISVIGVIGGNGTSKIFYNIDNNFFLIIRINLVREIEYYRKFVVI